MQPQALPAWRAGVATGTAVASRRPSAPSLPYPPSALIHADIVMCPDSSTASDQSSASIVVLLTTVAQRQQAQTLARALVEQRLVACAQIDAIESVYRWEGALQQEPEFRLWLKTTAERVPAAVAALRAQHPYTLPQIVVLAAQASADYAHWVGAQVQP